MSVWSWIYGCVKKLKEPVAKMSFDEFIKWYEHQEGRWELHDGIPVRRHNPAKGHSERLRHIRVKCRIARELEDAIDKAGLECEALGDGATVKIDDNISYEPDALVYCGDKIDGGELIMPEPVIIVEVLSPSTTKKDEGDKLVDYFRLSSVAHYIIIDPKNCAITHYYRDGKKISQKLVDGNELALDPPGIISELGELFAD